MADVRQLKIYELKQLYPQVYEVFFQEHDNEYHERYRKPGETGREYFLRVGTQLKMRLEKTE